MEQEKFEKHYIDLLNDNDFERLELLLKQPNIFNILRSQHSELKHSNFLSWLLNPNENQWNWFHFSYKISKRCFN